MSVLSSCFCKRPRQICSSYSSVNTTLSLWRCGRSIQGCSICLTSIVSKVVASFSVVCRGSAVDLYEPSYSMERKNWRPTAQSREYTTKSQKRLRIPEISEMSKSINSVNPASEFFMQPNANHMIKIINFVWEKISSSRLNLTFASCSSFRSC